MELRHLRYFVTVVEEAGFERAARRLDIAQPALSKQIKDLEREVGAALLERRPRVRPTPAGEKFLLDARKALEHASRAVTEARTAVDQTPCSIAIAHGRILYYPQILTRVLSEFQQRHPGMTLDLHQCDEAPMRAALQARRIDLGVAFVSRFPVPDLAAAPLCDCRLSGVLIHETNPLALKPEISLSDLKDSMWFHMPRAALPEMFHAIITAFRERGFTPRFRRVRPEDMSSAAVAMAAMGGWMLAVENMDLFARVKELGLVYRRFVEPPIPMWLAVHWRIDEANPLVLELVQLIQEISAGKTRKSD